MKAYKFLRLLYGLHIITLTYIAFFVIYIGIFYENYGYKEFFISVITVLSFLYLSDRQLKNKKLILALPMLLSCALTIIFYGHRWLLYYIPSLLTLIYTSHKNVYSLSPDYLKEEIKKGIYVIMALGIVVIFLREEYTGYILRFYILYLLLSVWMLRQSSRLQYEIKGRKSLINDVFIMVAVLILSMDFFYNNTVKIIKTIYSYLMEIFDKLIYIFLYLIKDGFQWLYYRINLSSQGLNTEANNEKVNEFEFMDMEAVNYHILSKLLKLAVLAVIIYIIYKAFKRLKLQSEYIAEGVLEEREKISKESLRKRSLDRLKEVFKNMTPPKNPRGRVLYYFGKIQRFSQGKDIFRNFMTATQLMRILKLKGNYGEDAGVEEIGNIYNKAKFSMNEIKDSDSEKLQKGYRDIKKLYRE
ncbi:hypothetical protein [Clostridium polynesiense]|uniref:hypothetical protein n=1 Tax=Clostridium polynesiense TaxID=1325933 RepID=UPI00058D5C62|nr:hypothetical protein [Clostridium polynesiense]